MWLVVSDRLFCVRFSVRDDFQRYSFKSEATCIYHFSRIFRCTDVLVDHLRTSRYFYLYDSIIGIFIFCTTRIFHES